MPAAAGAEEQQEVGEEQPRVCQRAAPRPPTKLELADHYAIGHAVFRSWCRHCVNSRGIGEQHRPQAAQQAAEEHADPVVVSDYGSMGDTEQEETMPILVTKDRTTKGYAATAIPRKGVHLFNIKFFAGVVKELGWKRMVSKSDGEHSLVALKQAVSDSMPGVEMVMQESPVGDHQANGEAENAVKEVKRMVRVLRATLEERIGKKLPVDHPLWTWLPRHAAACLSRYRIGPDGRTTEQRRTGRAWAKAAVEFGERIHARPAVAQEPRSGFAPKMVEGRYVGHQSRTGKPSCDDQYGRNPCQGIQQDAGSREVDQRRAGGPKGGTMADGAAGCG